MIYLWNITKTLKSKCFSGKYVKTSESRGCGNISPQLKKIKKYKSKEKERERKVTYLLFTLYLIKTCGGLLVFFNKIETKMIDLFVMFKRIR